MDNSKIEIEKDVMNVKFSYFNYSKEDKSIDLSKIAKLKARRKRKNKHKKRYNKRK